MLFFISIEGYLIARMVCDAAKELEFDREILGHWDSEASAIAFVICLFASWFDEFNAVAHTNVARNNKQK